jgi:hypothetical protein
MGEYQFTTRWQSDDLPSHTFATRVEGSGPHWDSDCPHWLRDLRQLGLASALLHATISSLTLTVYSV